MKIQYSPEIRKFVKFCSVLLTISFLLASLTISNYYITPIESQNDNFQDLKSAQSWILSPIIIDDNGGGDYTWAQAVLGDWCSGSGTYSDPYIIENIIINGQNSSSCLTIKDSIKYFIIRNCTFYNAGLSPNAGLKLDVVQNGYIYKNNVSFNNRWGIHLHHGYNTSVFKNLAVKNTGNNIFLSYSHENIIEQNNASEGNYCGIKLENSYNNTVFNNTANNNNQAGINISWFSYNNTVINNKVNDNDNNGIWLDNNCTENKIIKNYVEGNNYGISFWQGCSKNIVTGNIIDSNTVYGLSIYYFTGTFSDENLIYNNSFTGNGNQARDYGVKNYWNNSLMGNYWSDYSDVDADDDGIGDVPYSIAGPAGSQDYLPLWDDGIEGSVIFINGMATGVGAHNWTWARNRFWCSGSGIYNDPYLLKNLIINATGGEYGIKISNSDVFFIIENCKIANTGNTMRVDACIKFDNTTNGYIFNNHLSNTGIGIYSILLLDSTNNTIDQNNATNNNNVGILLIRSDYNRVLHNFASYNGQDGIYLETSSFNLVDSNNVTVNSWNGIIMRGNSHNNTIIWNNVSDSGVVGICIRTDIGPCNNNTIYNNRVIDNNAQSQDDGTNNQWDNGIIGNYWSDYGGVDSDDDGIGDSPYSIGGTASSQDNYPIWDDGFDLGTIFINGTATGVGAQNWIWASSKTWCTGTGVFADPYVIQDLTIDAQGGEYGIKIENSDVYFRIENCTIFNSKNDGYYAGILLNNTNNGEIFNNNCSNNYCGILLLSSNNNTIHDNIGSNCNEVGILLRDGSSNNNISNNKCDNNADTWGYGIGLWVDCLYNTVLYNNASSNTWAGITLRDGSHNNTVTGNRVIANYHGIELYNNCDNNTIKENHVSDNYGNGGWDRSSECENNIWYLNSFINPGVPNGVETGTSNKWDNGSIGNYWSDYGGIDADDNGVGDTPYVAGNLVDNYPIWEDEDDLFPTINIISPIPNQPFNENAPDFIVEVYDTNLDIMWYTIDGGLTNITFISNGTIDQNNWTAHIDDPITITFYANDTFGHINSAQVLIYKDTSIPNLNIISPAPNQLFGDSAPSFDIEISDPNLDTMWYTIDGGLTNITFISNGTIDQNNWTAHIDDPVIITFYANDTLGKIAFQEVIVRKDIESPIISILKPTMNEVFEIPPAYEITINEANLDKIWYTIDGGTPVLITGVIGTIDQTLWNLLSEGPVTIRFYSNDTVGNIGFRDVIVYKQIEHPTGDIPIMAIIIIASIVGSIVAIVLTIIIVHRVKAKKPKIDEKAVKAGFIYCPLCHNKIHAGETHCSYCGAALKL